MDSYLQMRKFLDYNKMAYNSGYARVDDLHVKYDVGNLCLEDCFTHIIFNVQHDFADRIQMPYLDTDRLYIGFNDKWQDFVFNKELNALTISSRDSSNKHNKMYQVSISR